METRALRYLDPASLRAWRPDPSARLRLEVAGERTVLGARFRRAFPASDPDRHIVVLEGGGDEVGILPSLDGLEPQTAALLREELDRQYFTPRISQIHELRQEAGMWRFTVDTQRGSTSFFVRNWRDSAHELRPGRWLIHAVDGGRFEILDVEAMDARSQRLLDDLL